ncbi:MAG: phage holin family protein [Candidatus Moranbacteria bacterium]|nr:phage holin family protein [Candidatus Moranbacteria bacterium]
MELIISWTVLSIAVFVVTYTLPGVTVANWMTAFVTALALGLVNALFKPILIFLTLPINILTLGLFTIIINALLVFLVSMVVPNFSVRNFWWAIAFSVVVAIINMILLGFVDFIF